MSNAPFSPPQASGVVSSPSPSRHVTWVPTLIVAALGGVSLACAFLPQTAWWLSVNLWASFGVFFAFVLVFILVLSFFIVTLDDGFRVKSRKTSWGIGLRSENAFMRTRWMREWIPSVAPMVLFFSFGFGIRALPVVDQIVASNTLSGYESSLVFFNKNSQAATDVANLLAMAARSPQSFAAAQPLISKKNRDFQTAVWSDNARRLATLYNTIVPNPAALFQVENDGVMFENLQRDWVGSIHAALTAGQLSSEQAGVARRLLAANSAD